MPSARSSGARPALPPLLTTLLLALGLSSVGAASQDPQPIFNGGFEELSFAGWVQDDVALPLIPLAVTAAGGDNPDLEFFRFDPTEGQFAVRHGFDGNGPGAIRLSRALIIQPTISVLRFDYRAAWDLTAPGATQKRSFQVEFREWFTDELVAGYDVLDAHPGTRVTDTGPVTVTIPLTDLPARTMRVVFRWNIPESFTGPGHFLFDNVQLLPIAESRPPRARVKLNFRRDARDSLKLKMAVSVPPGFSPEGQAVHVAFGRHEVGATLDDKGRSKSDTHVIRMRPVKNDPLLWRLSLKLRRAQLRDDLAHSGLQDADVPKPGAMLSLPIHVTVGGHGTETMMRMSYRAKAGKRGVAKSIR